MQQLLDLEALAVGAAGLLDLEGDLVGVGGVGSPGGGDEPALVLVVCDHSFDVVLTVEDGGDAARQHGQSVVGVSQSSNHGEVEHGQHGEGGGVADCEG